MVLLSAAPTLQVLCACHNQVWMHGEAQKTYLRTVSENGGRIENKRAASKYYDIIDELSGRAVMRDSGSIIEGKRPDTYQAGEFVLNSLAPYGGLKNATVGVRVEVTSPIHPCPFFSLGTEVMFLGPVLGAVVVARVPSVDIVLDTP
jgi:hypothetical protein